MTASFRGWPDSALGFYRGLEADNSKAYFEANRTVYDDDVRAPFEALSALVVDEFGPLRLFRPYRDTRFSKDKTPYKTAQGAVTEGEGGTTFYVQLGAAGLFVGSGHYHFASDQLTRWRDAVADDRSGAEAEAAFAAVRAAGLDTRRDDSLKRAPRGYPVDHPRIELLRQKGCHAGRQFVPAQWVATPKALDRIVGTWRAALPLTDWLDAHVGPSELPPY